MKGSLRLYIASIFVLVLNGCVTENKNSIITKNGNIDLKGSMVFRTIDDEVVLSENTAAIANYDRLKPNQTYKLAHYASIDHEDYMIHIAVPEDESFKSLKARPLPSHARMIQKTGVGQSFEYRLYQLNRDSSYVGELLYRMPRADDLYLVIGQSKLKNGSVRQLSRESMVSRFIRPKE